MPVQTEVPVELDVELKRTLTLWLAFMPRTYAVTLVPVGAPFGVKLMLGETMIVADAVLPLVPPVAAIVCVPWTANGMVALISAAPAELAVADCQVDPPSKVTVI